MQYMVQIQPIYVFAGDDVDLAVPVAVQSVQQAELFLLLSGQRPEQTFCSVYEFRIVHLCRFWVADPSLRSG